MTSRPAFQCELCAHFRSPLDGAAERSCDAFPERIPGEIWAGRADHRKPFPGDHGIQWESEDGAAFPDA